MRKTPFILAMLLIYSNLLSAQSFEHITSYFWDAEAVDKILSSPVLMTFLIVGSIAAILVTICSYTAEREWASETSRANTNTNTDDGLASSSSPVWLSESPKPACRLLQQFVNLIPPGRD